LFCFLFFFFPWGFVRFPWMGGGDYVGPLLRHIHTDDI
jgi:hypothetical protein